MKRKGGKINVDVTWMRYDRTMVYACDLSNIKIWDFFNEQLKETWNCPSGHSLDYWQKQFKNNELSKTSNLRLFNWHLMELKKNPIFTYTTYAKKSYESVTLTFNRSDTLLELKQRLLKNSVFEKSFMNRYNSANIYRFNQEKNKQFSITAKDYAKGSYKETLLALFKLVIIANTPSIAQKNEPEKIFFCSSFLCFPVAWTFEKLLSRGYKNMHFSVIYPSIFDHLDHEVPLTLEQMGAKRIYYAVAISSVGKNVLKRRQENLLHKNKLNEKEQYFDQCRGEDLSWRLYFYDISANKEYNRFFISKDNAQSFKLVFLTQKIIDAAEVFRNIEKYYKDTGVKHFPNTVHFMRLHDGEEGILQQAYAKFCGKAGSTESNTFQERANKLSNFLGMNRMTKFCHSVYRFSRVMGSKTLSIEETPRGFSPGENSEMLFNLGELHQVYELLRPSSVISLLQHCIFLYANAGIVGNKRYKKDYRVIPSDLRKQLDMLRKPPKKQEEISEKVTSNYGCTIS